MDMRDETQLKRIVTGVVALGALLLVGCQSNPPQEEIVLKEIVYPSPPDEPRYYYERTLVGTGDAVKETSEMSMKATLTGVKEYQGVGFQKPFDVEVQRGRVYVSDTVSRMVMVLDFPNGRSFHIGDRGDQGDLVKPMGLALAEDGTLYVVDATNKAVFVYDQDGNFLRTLGEVGDLSRPAGAAISRDGSEVYVVDVGGVRSENHGIKVFDTVTGQLKRVLGTRGTEESEFNLPRDVEVDPDGNLIITDGGNFRIQRITPQGEFLQKWGTPGRRPGQFTRAKGISTDKEGRIYVVDAAFGNFQIFDKDMKLLMFIGNRSTNAEPGGFMLPNGIDVDEDGRVYMVGQFHRKVDVFRPAGLAKNEGSLAKQP